MAIAIGAAVSIGTSVVGSQLNKAISGGGASGGTGISGGGGGIQPNEQAFYGSNASNPFYGVNVSSKPMGDQQTPKSPEMPIEGGSVSRGKATNPKETPTQSIGMDQARNDFKDIWADRLSKYLDYNTRSLG